MMHAITPDVEAKIASLKDQTEKEKQILRELIASASDIIERCYALRDENEEINEEKGA